MNTTPDYSIVIPCHNEASRIDGLLGRVQRAFAGLDYECIVVIDGCTDESEAVVRAIALAMPNIRILSGPTRLGKGKAIKQGVLEARGAYIGFIDGDDEIDPKFLRESLDRIKSGDADIVVGNRHANGGAYHTTTLRHLTSKIYQTMVWLLFALEQHDSQAGMKAFRNSVARQLFSASMIDGYAFDIDILSRAHWMRLRVKEIPIEQQYKGVSRITFQHTLEMILDTCRVYDRHVREIVGRWARRESIGALPVIRSFAFLPFTTIIAFGLKIVLRKRSA